jgi:hypothetical protein
MVGRAKLEFLLITAFILIWVTAAAWLLWPSRLAKLDATPPPKPDTIICSGHDCISPGD